MLNIAELPELRGWSVDGATIRLGSAVTFTELMEPAAARLMPALSEAARTIGSLQIRNIGTLGGNLGTASPAGDALPALLVNEAIVELVSLHGRRSVPLRSFLLGPKKNALAASELIAAVTLQTGGRQTFLKIGPRNAMVISVASLALRRDKSRGILRAAFGSAGPVPILVDGDPDVPEDFPEKVAAAASPIDDVRGTAAYRRHALAVMTRRALSRLN
jgi:CO/xanthine dehydrogenase FAD-binding subunit